MTAALRDRLLSLLTAAKIRIRIGRGKGNGEKVAKLLSQTCFVSEIIVFLHKNIALVALKDYVCRSSLGRCTGAIFVSFG